MESPLEQVKAMKLQVAELGLSIGNVLLPAVALVTRPLGAMAGWLSQLISNHTLLARGIGVVIVGLTGAAAAWTTYRTAVMAAGIATKLGLLPGTATVLPLLRTALTSVARVLSGPLLAGIRAVGLALTANPLGLIVAGIAVAAFLIYKYWQPIKAFFAGLWDGIVGGLQPVLDELAGAFSGMGLVFAPIGAALAPIGELLANIWGWFTTLLQPVQSSSEELANFAATGRSVGEVIGVVLGWLLRPLVLLGNGIALLVKGFVGLGEAIGTGLAMAVEGISGFISGIWSDIKTAFSGGLAGIGALLSNWSPLGLLYAAFSTALGALGIDLPAKFSDFGGMLIDGLIGGITGGIGAVGEAVSGLADSTVGWFKSKLGINSPSRVFAEMGRNISEGTAGGIASGNGLAAQASANMAQATITGWGAPELAGLSVAPVPLIGAPSMANDGANFVPNVGSPTSATRSAANGTMGSAGQTTITFAPNITIAGGDASLGAQINSAMQLSFEEFKKLMERYDAQRRRQSFGSA